MNLDGYLTPLREQFLAAASAQGEESRAIAERLVVPFESALRLTLLEALSGAAEEITSDLAPGTVDVRLRGGEPEFVVTVPTPEPVVADDEPAPAAPEPDDSPLTRINLRLGESLKSRIEEAAAAEKISVNSWLVRAAENAVSGRVQGRFGTVFVPPTITPPSGPGQRFTGWVR